MSPQTDRERAFIDFLLVDVFTDVPLTGNPLALVPDADGLDDETMRQLARELNQVETTFVVRPTQAGADWRLRSFTAAGVEVSGAGHNALGAWWWLAHAGRLPLDASHASPASPRADAATLDAPTDGSSAESRAASSAFRFTHELGGRLLPVDIFVRDGVVEAVEMAQTPPAFGAEIHAPDALSALASALRLSVTDLRGAPLAPQVVSTGAAHLLVPLADRQAVSRARPDVDRLAAVLRDADGEGCYLFALDPISPDATAHARFFNPTVGIIEDVATGSAAGPLACYLIARGLHADGRPVIVEQGHDLQRPSRIEVIARGTEVRLAGRGVVAAEGRIRVPLA